MFFILLPTLECNLACPYCFEEHPAGRWDIQTTRRILENIFELLQERNLDRCRFHWQGGEPLLLGKDYWEEALCMADSFARRQGVQLIQSMQTNLTLYQSGFKSIVREYLDNVLGTSFEPNGVRCFPKGSQENFSGVWKTAYDTALADGLEVGVLSLLTPEVLEIGAESYLSILYQDYNIRRVRFTLPFRQPGQQGKGFWLEARKAGLFLAEAYKVWQKAGGDDWMEIRPFTYLAQRIRGETPNASGLCLYSRNCADIALSILPNGDVTLCDSFSDPEAEMMYGNIFESDLKEMYGRPQIVKVRQKVAELMHASCHACRYLAYCFGGCLVRSSAHGETKDLHYHYCETNKILFQAIEDLAFTAPL